MLACATVLGALWALSRSPAFVENAYARRISFQLGRALSIVSGLVPASLAEIALASLVTYALVAISVVTIHLSFETLERRNESFATLCRVSFSFIDQ